MNVGVEAATNDTGVAGVIATNVDAPTDADLGAVWDRMERDNGSERGEGGRFVSRAGTDTGTNGNAAGDEAGGDTNGPLEGGEGGDANEGEISTPPAAVPLPSNWRGLEEVWGKLPPEVLEPIAAHQAKLHQTLSQQGQQLSAYKPLGDVLMEYKEYFNGEKMAVKPHDAVNFLLSMQRGMDTKPIETMLEIADRYDLRGALAQALGTAQQPAGEGQQTDNTQALMARIGQLEQIIRDSSDPSKIDQRISQKLDEDRAIKEVNDVISRTATKEAMPLYADVEAELPEYIRMAKAKLGDTASQEAVLKRAYDMAVNADPDLRKKAAALQNAVVPDPKQVAAAKNANASNIRSTSTGKPREATEDELLSAVYDKHKKG